MSPRSPVLNRGATLTEAQRRRVVDAHRDGVTAQDIANRFWVSKELVLRVLREERARLTVAG